MRDINKRRKPKKGLRIVFFLVIAAIFIAVFMWLWNALIPCIIGWSAINYWQAAGLLILSKLLFGGFGRFGMGGMHQGFHKNPFFEKMHSLSPEERRDYIRRRMQGGPFCDKDKPENPTSTSQTEN